MQQLELINGFSDLKSLLIKTYDIEKDRSELRLYFNEKNNYLTMHDYRDHKKIIILCLDIKKRYLVNSLSDSAYKLVKESLNQPSPSDFLNNGFKLCGFFRS